MGSHEPAGKRGSFLSRGSDVFDGFDRPSSAVLFEQERRRASTAFLQFVANSPFLLSAVKKTLSCTYDRNSRLVQVPLSTTSIGRRVLLCVGLCEELVRLQANATSISSRLRSHADGVLQRCNQPASERNADHVTCVRMRAGRFGLVSTTTHTSRRAVSSAPSHFVSPLFVFILRPPCCATPHKSFVLLLPGWQGAFCTRWPAFVTPSKGVT